MVGARNWLAIGLGFVWIAGAASALAADEKPTLDGSATLSQGEWAKMLVAKLGATSALRENAPVDEYVSLLGARGFTVSRDGKSAKPVTSDGNTRAWRYDLELPRTALWLLTVKNGLPVFANVDRTKSVLLPAGGADGATDLGIRPLASGAHAVSLTAKDVATAPEITAVAGCNPILPAGGWQPSAKLTFGNLGRTLVQAIRQNGRLPASEGLAVLPAASAKLSLDVPSEGTYTVLLGGKALERASYRLGGCEETTPGPATADGWREGTTVLLTAGAQTLEISGIDAKKTDGRVRLVRRAGADAEYLAVLQSMGVKLPSVETKTGLLDGGDSETRVGLARRMSGDPASGNAALATKPVTRAQGTAVLQQLEKSFTQAREALGTSGGNSNQNKSKKSDLESQKQDLDGAGTLTDPVTDTVNPAQAPDPQ